MAEENKMIKTTVRIPEHLTKKLQEAAKNHYRHFNGEVIAAIESYLNDWKSQH
jgi:predicted DNA-binding protein